MTDNDFDKIGEDFDSEFEFVEPKGGDVAAPKAGGAAMAAGPARSSNNSMTIIIVISLIAGSIFGYIRYTSEKKHGEHDKTAATTPAEAAKTGEHNPMGISSAEKDAMASAITNEIVGSMENQTPGQAPGHTANPTTNHMPDQMANALPHTKPEEPKPNEAKTFEQVQKDLQSAKPAPAPTSTATMIAQSKMDTEVKSTLQSLSEEMTMNVNNIKQLENTIAQLTTGIDQLHKSVSAMDNRVLGLTETVDALSQDLTNVKKVISDEDLDLTTPGTVQFSNKAQNQSMNTGGSGASTPSYNVHAIIPGRAWLKSSSGQIITVTEGDKVGDFGTVAVIDSANGLVRTSSGIIFR